MLRYHWSTAVVKAQIHFFTSIILFTLITYELFKFYVNLLSILLLSPPVLLREINETFVVAGSADYH